MRSVLLAGGVVALVLAAAACGSDGDDYPAQTRSIEQVLEERTPALMAVSGVVGTGIGECDGTPCIKVFVETTTVAVGEEVPAEIEGYVVVVEETGPITALDPEQAD